MSDFDFDAVVVGAGAVGLACGRAIARRGQSVLVMEAEAAIGQGVSSRNSEVIHGGLYYPTGSLKARFCVQGRRLMYPFLDAHNVAYRRCGKFVVATSEAEVERIEAIAEQARINDVEGIELITGAAAMAAEPGLKAHAAVVSPESGVMDSHGYMLALQGEIENAGGVVILGTPMLAARPLEAGGFAVDAGGAEPMTLTARRLVTAPGLGAQAVAALIEGYPAARIPARHLGKGVYFKLEGRAPFERLIYPPPIPGALGTHYRKDLGGQAVFGPDLAYVDQLDFTVDATRAAEFYAYIRKFWPDLPDGVLVPDYAGIRPKIHGPDEPAPDFRLDGQDVHGLPGLVALFGIESPGLTSSLAIGEAVAAMLTGGESPPQRADAAGEPAGSA
jgi:L-2-hydroxyglutarate oxidase LhgO